MANLVELFDNIVQMQALNGVPLANGKLYVYALGRTRLMDTWSDVDGESLNTNPIILDDAGQAHCFVSDDFDYTLVVCDAYNNEVFSIDKYLYSKGEHSHADVAVAPSEHIGVSSYHVGETTVYVPYIQGELGKTYHGIEPIVVNNQENKISARNIPLGVQEPLYFAEDSESACIIGLSGEYQPVTGMSGYATTGDLVDLATSVSETYQPKGDYATHDDLSGFMEESKLETADGKITGYDGTAFAGGGSVDPSEFIPWSASGNFATSGDLNDKLDTTAFSTVSGDFLTAIPDTYASKDFVSSSVSSKLDSTAFSTVSGDFITALPQGLLNESGFEYDGDKISAYNGSAFVGQGGGGITGEYELSAGNGISIENFPIEQKTVISVTAQGGDPEVEQVVKTQSATWDSVTGKQDNLNFGYNNTAISSIDSSGLYDTSAHARINTLAGRINTLSSDKLDTTAFSTVSGNFLTAHQSLADYQTTAGMTAYQPVGSYLTADALDNVSGNWNEVSAKADTSALDNYLPLSGGSISSNGSILRNAVTNIGLFLMSGNQQVAQYTLDRIENDNFSAYSTGIYSPHLTADNIKFLYSADGPGIYTVNSGFDNNTYALCQSSNSWQFGIGGPSAAFYATGVLGLTDISTQDRYLGQTLPSITVSSNYGALKLNSTGGEFILNPTSNNSAVNWRIGESTYLWNGQGDPNYNMPLLLAAMSKSQPWSNAPFISANYDHIELTKGTSGPRAIVDAQYYSGGYSGANVYYYIGMNGIGCSGNSMDVQVYVPNQTATYSLRNSIQKTDIDGDSATSAITAIAGSAIVGGVSQSAFDELKQSYDALSALFAQYSGQWLLPNEGEE